MNVIEKLFCGHKWDIHAKSSISYEKKEVLEDTKHWSHPIIFEYAYTKTTEILLCQVCGKIKKITY